MLQANFQNFSKAIISISSTINIPSKPNCVHFQLTFNWQFFNIYCQNGFELLITSTFQNFDLHLEFSTLYTYMKSFSIKYENEVCNNSYWIKAKTSEKEKVICFNTFCLQGNNHKSKLRYCEQYHNRNIIVNKGKKISLRSSTLIKKYGTFL